jgi:hypothetical protein
MAGWHTVLVEVPLATLAPVKTVFDLLPLEHQTDCHRRPYESHDVGEFDCV